MRSNLGSSFAILDPDQIQDRQNRLFIIKQDGTVSFIGAFGNGEQENAVKKEMQEASLDGRLMCFPLASDKPVQIITDEKGQISLSKPWSPDAMQQPQAPNMSFFKWLLSSIFPIYVEERAAYDRQLAQYNQARAAYDRFFQLNTGMQTALQTRTPQRLEDEDAISLERQITQQYLKKAVTAQDAYKEISDGKTALHHGKTLMSPEYNVTDGNRKVVPSTFLEIYQGTPEYIRREQNTTALDNKIAQIEGTVTDSAQRQTQIDRLEREFENKGILDNDWYGNHYLKLRSNDFTNLAILAYAAQTGNRGIPGTEELEQLLGQFRSSEDTYTNQQKENMLLARSQAVRAVNHLMGNTTMEPDPAPLGALIANGLRQLCRITMNGPDYNGEEAGKVSILRDALYLINRQPKLMEAAKNHGLDDQLLNTVRGIVLYGNIIEDGLRAKADLCQSAYSGKSSSNPKEMIVRIQAMNLVRQDLMMLKQQRQEYLNDMAECRQIGSNASFPEQLLLDQISTDMQQALGSHHPNSATMLYSTLKALPDNQALWSLPPTELLDAVNTSLPKLPKDAPILKTEESPAKKQEVEKKHDPDPSNSFSYDAPPDEIPNLMFS